MRLLLVILAISVLSSPAYAWRRLETKDPINDKVTTSIYTISTGEDGTESDAMFGVICTQAKQLFFTVGFKDGLNSSGDTVWVFYRVDDKRAVGGNWTIVRNNPVAMLPYRPNIKVDFAGGTRLAIRATGQQFGPSERTALFDISGIDQTFADAEAACGGK